MHFTKKSEPLCSNTCNSHVQLATQCLHNLCMQKQCLFQGAWLCFTFALLFLPSCPSYWRLHSQWYAEQLEFSWIINGLFLFMQQMDKMCNKLQTSLGGQRFYKLTRGSKGAELCYRLAVSQELSPLIRRYCSNSMFMIYFTTWPFQHKGFLLLISLTVLTCIRRKKKPKNWEKHKMGGK